MRLLRCLVSLVAAVASAAAASAQSATATLRGTVRSAATGTLVESASVTLAEANRSTLTAADGTFALGGLAPGSYRVVVASAGFEEKVHPVALAAGAEVGVELRLESAVVRLSAVTVSAQAEGQAQALNLQRFADSIRKIASQDALATARAGEVGEALQTLPGVYLEISTHQPARAVLRGVQSQYNSLTFDGVRAGNTNADRADTVSAFPAESLQRVELFKSVTPDLPGDAIGGAINLVSRRAFDLSAPLLRLTLGQTYNDQQQNWDKQFNFDYGRTYLDGRLGVFVSANHYRTDRGYHEATQSYAVDAQERFTISNLTLLDRVEDDSWKLKLSGSVEYKLTKSTIVSFSALYSNDSRSLEDRRVIFSGGTRTFVSPDAFTVTGARLGLDRRFRTPVSVTRQVGLGARHDFDLWDIDYRASYIEATNRYDETFYPALRSPATGFAVDRSVRDFPAFRGTSGIDFNHPALYEHNGVQRTQNPTGDDGIALQLNARRALPAVAEKSYFKTGLNYSARWWRQTAPGVGNWTYAGPSPTSAAAFVEPYNNSRFLNEAPRGRLLVPNVNVNLDAFLDAFYRRPQDFARQNLASDLLILQRTQSLAEKIAAGYAMASFGFGRLGVLTGARLEHTDYSGKAYRVNQSTTTITGVTRSVTTLRDTQVLPGIHFNYAFNPQLIARAAVYRTIARPAGSDLLPSSTINDTSRTVTEGNPNLEVTESTNFDVSLEYYLKPIGVLSAGAFRKDIDGFFYSNAGTIVGGLYDGYSLNNSTLGRGGRVEGLELEWQQRLGFLPGLLAKLTLGSNFTWIESRGEYPTRPGAGLTFTGTAPRNGNVNLSFAHAGFDVRAFLNYRDTVLNTIGARRTLDVYEQSRKTIDVLLRYKARGSRFNYQVSAKNLGNAPRITWQGDRGNPRSVRFFDWSVSTSVGYDF
jgi:TonB-dependent receptor